jgi:hypothetical protein
MVIVFEISSIILHLTLLKLLSKKKKNTPQIIRNLDPIKILASAQLIVQDLFAELVTFFKAHNILIDTNLLDVS